LYYLVLPTKENRATVLFAAVALNIMITDDMRLRRISLYYFEQDVDNKALGTYYIVRKGGAGNVCF